MSDKLIKDVRSAIMRSTTTTRSHGIVRNGYEPVVMRGKLPDCVNAVIYATGHLVDLGYSTSDFNKYLKCVSHENHNALNFYVFADFKEIKK